jgi:hypothetical protein
MWGSRMVGTDDNLQSRYQHTFTRNSNFIFLNSSKWEIGLLALSMELQIMRFQSLSCASSRVWNDNIELVGINEHRIRNASQVSVHHTIHCMKSYEVWYLLSLLSTTSFPLLSLSLSLEYYKHNVVRSYPHSRLERSKRSCYQAQVFGAVTARST